MIRTPFELMDGVVVEIPYMDMLKGTVTVKNPSSILAVPPHPAGFVAPGSITPGALLHTP